MPVTITSSSSSSSTTSPRSSLTALKSMLASNASTSTSVSTTTMVAAVGDASPSVLLSQIRSGEYSRHRPSTRTTLSCSLRSRSHDVGGVCYSVAAIAVACDRFAAERRRCAAVAVVERHRRTTPSVACSPSLLDRFYHTARPQTTCSQAQASFAHRVGQRRLRPSTSVFAHCRRFACFFNTNQNDISRVCSIIVINNDYNDNDAIDIVTVDEQCVNARVIVVVHCWQRCKRL